MKTYCNEIYQDMKSELQEIQSLKENVLQQAEESFLVTYKALEKLKAFILEYTFTGEEEIDFFKHVKPRFQAELIYYGELFYLHSTMPVGNKEMLKHYQRQMAHIRAYFQRHQYLFTYFRLASTNLDDHLFKREAPLLPFIPEKPCLHMDNRFATIGSYRFSMFRAYIHLKAYLEKKIFKLKNPTLKTREQKLKWTAPKVALVELTYAFKAAGVFNHGQVSIRDIATHLEEVFQQDMSQYYRTFQEIRIRKTGRANFLDRLKRSLEKWMDNSDFGGKGELP